MFFSSENSRGGGGGGGGGGRGGGGGGAPRSEKIEGSAGMYGPMTIRQSLQTMTLGGRGRCFLSGQFGEGCVLLKKTCFCVSQLSN